MCTFWLAGTKDFLRTTSEIFSAVDTLTDYYSNVVMANVHKLLM